jgi:glycosyltransferase involved in cell wall biosynthesis
MRVLFALTNAYPPQQFGGIQVNLDTLCRGLVTRGHDVTVVAKLARGDFVWVKRLLKKTFGFAHVAERFGNYSLHRDLGVGETVEALRDRFEPDIFVVHDGWNAACQLISEKLLIPMAVHLHALPPITQAKQLYQVGVRDFACCSSFLANKLTLSLPTDERIRIDVIFNAFDHSRYMVNEKSSGQYVTFINPVRQKGVGLALDIAGSLPEVSFLFVKGWRCRREKFAPVISASRRLRNITIREATRDMKSVYRDTRVLLMPSQVEEGAGRVITEAQINAIPVIGSNLGGIPETIGDGGVLLPHNDSVAWSETIRKLLCNPDEWQKLSRAARANSLLERFSLQKTLDAYEHFLCRAAFPVRQSSNGQTAKNILCAASA